MNYIRCYQCNGVSWLSHIAQHLFEKHYQILDDDVNKWWPRDNIPKDFTTVKAWWTKEDIESTTAQVRNGVFVFCRIPLTSLMQFFSV